MQLYQGARYCLKWLGKKLALFEHLFGERVRGAVLLFQYVVLESLFCSYSFVWGESKGIVFTRLSIVWSFKRPPDSLPKDKLYLFFCAALQNELRRSGSTARAFVLCRIVASIGKVPPRWGFSTTTAKINVSTSYLSSWVHTLIFVSTRTYLCEYIVLISVSTSYLFQWVSVQRS